MVKWKKNKINWEISAINNVSLKPIRPGLVLIRNENEITIQEENKLLFEQIEIIYVHDVSKQESFFYKGHAYAQIWIKNKLISFKLYKRLTHLYTYNKSCLSILRRHLNWFCKVVYVPEKEMVFLQGLQLQTREQSKSQRVEKKKKKKKKKCWKKL